MTSYVGLIDRSSEGPVGIWFPDLPGCTAMADTRDELVTTAAEVMRMWMDVVIARGGAVPVARDIAALRDDPDVQEALREDGSSFVEISMLP